jgi:hypothetical protein
MSRLGQLRRTQSEHIFSGLPQIPDIRRSRSRLPHAARLTAPAFEPILRLVRLNPEAPTEFKAGQHLSGRHLMTTPQVDLGKHELSAIVRWEEQTLGSVKFAYSAAGPRAQRAPTATLISPSL